MKDLETVRQSDDSGQSGRTPPGTTGEENRGADFGTAERATRGTDRDADRSGESKNPGHGHPREERHRERGA